MLNKENIQYITKLSPLQEGIFFHHLLDKSSQDYFMQTVFYVNGNIDPDAFEKSFQFITDRHDILRAVFIKKDAISTRQIILRSVDYRLDFIDLTDDEDKLADIIRNDRHVAFDLGKGKLIRLTLVKLSPSRHVIVWSHHHIIMDGWCIPPLLGEFMEVYFSFARKAEPKLLQAPSYSDYIKWLQDTDQERSLFYWKQYLEGYEGTSIVPGATGSAYGPVALVETGLRFDSKVLKEMSRRCAAGNVTLNTMVETIWGILLSRYNDSGDVLFGSVVSGRPPEVDGVESMIGLFINTIPVRIIVDEDQTLASLMRSVQQRAIQSLPHHYVQLADVLQSDRVIHHILAFENYPAPVRRDKSEDRANVFGIERTESFSQTNYDFSIVVFHTDDLYFKFGYNSNRYSAETIERIKGHFSQLIDQFIRNPDTRIANVDILADAEKKLLQQLGTPGRSPDGRPPAETIITLFESAVSRYASDTALVFEHRSFTYQALNDEVNRVANYLGQTYHILPNDVVAVMASRSHRMIVGMLAILKSGAAYLPIDPAYPSDRIRHIVADAVPKALLCDSEYMFAVSEFFEGDLFVLDIQEGKMRTGKNNPVQVCSPGDAAYVIYTSGSTGVPKGVMVEHFSVVNLCQWHHKAFAVSDTSRATCYSGYGFDAFGWEVFPYLTAGGQVHVVSEKMKMNMESLHEYLDTNGITHVFLPTPVLRSVMQEAAGTFIRNKTIILTGGDSLKNFDTDLPVYNNYGPTENTVVTTSGLIDKPRDSKITIGRPIENCEVLVLDRKQRLLPAGCTGEICIAGHGLARGYINDPEMTATKFVSNPYNDGLMYRSGDRGRWTSTGEIEFEGRMDDQIKVRGHRVELEEIENALIRYPGISEAVAAAKRGNDGFNFIVGYYLGVADEAKLRDSLRSSLPEYMMPAYIMSVDAIPLTPNGKVDRKSLPMPSPRSPLENNELPITHVANVLRDIWKDVLATQELGKDSNFFDAGGHSIKAVQLISRIKKELQVAIELRDVFTYVTLGELFDFVSRAAEEKFNSIPASPARQFYPPTRAQRRLYILSQLEGGSQAYNMYFSITMHGLLDVAKLEMAVAYLVNRHESLRTVFKKNEVGEVVQEILDPPPAAGLKVIHADGEMMATIRSIASSEQGTSFDLERGPLFRITLIAFNDDLHVLMLTMHHIISDGWSMKVLGNELIETYNSYISGVAPDLLKLTIQYRDFAVWQEAQLAGPSLKKHEDFWLRQLGGQLPILDIIPDRQRPFIQTYDGKNITHALPNDALGMLRRMCKENNATFFIGLLAVTNALLSRYTGVYDIVVGTPVACRGIKELENQIGVYINTIALRTVFDPACTFAELLQIQRDVTLKAYEYQDYPFDMVVAKLQLPRDPGRSPVFDVMVEMQNDLADVSGKPVKMNGILLSETPSFGSPSSQFDLTFSFFDDGGSVDMSVIFNTNIYDAVTIERMHSHFHSMLKSFTMNPEHRISSCRMMDESEMALVTETFNATAKPYDLDKDVVTRFRLWVTERPNAIALSHNGEEVTFAELDRLSSKLSRNLSLHVARKPVAVFANRGIELIAAMLAIWKAGGIYVPIDPELGAKRIEILLQELRPVVVLSQSSLDFPFGDVRRIYIDTALQDVSESTNDQHFSVRPLDIAYILYTSGSTGKPKGAMLTHGGMLNHLLAMLEILDWRASDRIAQTARQGFDISVWQMTAGLVAGTATVIYDNDMIVDVAGLMRSISRDNVTILEVVPSYLSTILTIGDLDSLSKLKLMIVTGETFPGVLARKWFEMYQHVPIVNAYGPTEASDDVAIHIIESYSGEQIVPIGKPVYNIRIFILDDFGQVCPIGVKGRICVAGVGVGQGYLNDQVLTEKAFLTDTFSLEPNSHLYDTGDIGRYRRDGVLEYFGRRDNQVKILGQRVELEEIENAVRNCPGVSDAAAIVFKEEGAVRLIAFYIAEEAIPETDLVSHTSTYVQYGLVPSHFVWLPKFPLTLNGKIDRLALANCSLSDVIKKDAVHLPVNKIQRELRDIWLSVLNITDISTSADFFRMGGNSLKVFQLVFEIQKRLHVEISIPLMYLNQTIEMQAMLVIESFRTPGQNRLMTLFGSSLSANRADVVFLPPAIGLSYNYIPLIKTLNDKINSYLTHIKGVFEDSEPFRSMEEIVADYSKRVRDYLHDDRVVLVGYSAGAYVGFELGRNLSQLGYDVTVLIIDSPVQMFDDPDEERQKLIGRKDTIINEHMKRVSGIVEENNVSHDMLERYRVVFFEYAKIIAGYSTKPGKVNMNCFVFYLEGQPLAPSKFDLWEDFVAGDFRSIPLPAGDHADLMSDAGNLKAISDFMMNELIHVGVHAQ